MDKKAKQKIFITGGAGFIGSHTVDRLVNEGKDVTVFDIKSWGEAKNIHNHKDVITYIEGDIRDFNALKDAMKGHTHVLHLAAIVSVPLSIQDPVSTHRTNAVGTLNVLESARQVGVKRVVYASSAAVYGDSNELPLSEDTQCLPQSPYGVHKQMNEEDALLYRQLFNLSVVGLRYFNVFGTRQDPSSPYSGVISIFADKTMKGKKISIFGDGSATRDFVHIDNVVEANLKALGSAVVGVFNVASGTATSISELVEHLKVISGKSFEIEFLPEREGDIKHSLASIENIKKQLEYRIIQDFESGLKTLFDFTKTQV